MKKLFVYCYDFTISGDAIVVDFEDIRKGIEYAKSIKHEDLLDVVYGEVVDITKTYSKDQIDAFDLEI